jgi:hypothetical protein
LFIFVKGHNVPRTFISRVAQNFRCDGTASGATDGSGQAADAGGSQSPLAIRAI